MRRWPDGRPRVMDLQLFAEKTEEPTPKRRREARKRGEVFRSVEVNSAILLLVLFAGLRWFGPYMAGEIAALLRWGLTGPEAGELREPSLYAHMAVAGTALLRAVLPVGLLAVFAGIAVNLAQVGFVFSAEPLKFDLSRINPAAGLKRLFSGYALVELVKGVVKVAGVGYVVYGLLRAEQAKLVALIDAGIEEIVRVVANLASTVALRAGAVLLVLAGFDYLFQRWQHERGLRMSREELREEFKETEGHPQTRARIRERQRKMAMRRMMQEVAKADVVITNPVHLAVALRYEPARMAAPTVVAKGAGFLAEKLKEIARAHSVVVFEDAFLTQALYKSADIGDMVPVELYQAVAEVLAFVYRLKGRVR